MPADILDRVTPKLHELGLDYECVGGGRIRHDSKDKKIHIYGYSVVSPMHLMNISCIVSQLPYLPLMRLSTIGFVSCVASLMKVGQSSSLLRFLIVAVGHNSLK